MRWRGRCETRVGTSAIVAWACHAWHDCDQPTRSRHAQRIEHALVFVEIDCPAARDHAGHFGLAPLTVPTTSHMPAPARRNDVSQLSSRRKRRERCAKE